MQYMTTYPIIFAALFSWVFAQAMKLIIYLVIEGQINIAKLFDSGGMPSSHTALVTSLCTSVGLVRGWSSTEFAISAVLCSVVIYDATGIRRSAGRHAAALNELIPQLLAGKLLRNKKNLGQEYRELLGHNPFEVFVGAIVGVFVTLLFLYGYGVISHNPSDVAAVITGIQ